MKPHEIRDQAKEDLRLLFINSKALGIMAEHALEKREFDITTHNAIDGFIDQIAEIQKSLCNITRAISLSDES